MITANAQQKLQEYNKLCLHYNLVADSVYIYRQECDDLFSENYLRYIVAALISFDMGRMMGEGTRGKYDVNQGEFAARLLRKLQAISQHIGEISAVSILNCDIDTLTARIQAAYQILSEGGSNSLSATEKEFHVGATKIMHFINPNLFLIIDSNAARAFHREHSIPYKNTTQPGYTAALYTQCIKEARQEIIDYGSDNFQALEPATPVMRIFDKLSFITGNNA